jgi:hypothetical protein
MGIGAYLDRPWLVLSVGTFSCLRGSNEYV